MLYSMYIMNKAGSLLFQKDFSAAMKPMKTNEKIMLSGLFHGLCAFAGQLSPTSDSSGIALMHADTFQLQRLTTLTGMQFIVLADPHHSRLREFLERVYQLYADYALKNPFHAMDMPIRSELFEAHLADAIADADRVGGWRGAGSATSA